MDGTDEDLMELHSCDAHEQDPVRNPNEIAWTRRIEWQHELDEAKYDLNVDMDYIGFREAILNANLEKVKASLSEGIVDPGILHNWAIRRACDAGALEIVELLLGVEGVDPAAVNSTAIVHAAQKGNESILAVLLTDGRSDPTVDDNQAIRSAATNGHADIVRMLLEDGRAYPAAMNNQALYIAAQDGLNDVVTLLLADNRVIKEGGGVAAAFAVASLRPERTDVDGPCTLPSTSSLFEGIYDMMVEAPDPVPPSFAIGNLSLSSRDINACNAWTDGQRRALSNMNTYHAHDNVDVKRLTNYNSPKQRYVI
jgi:hypothetical protein